MVAPLLCGTLAGVIPGIGILAATLLHHLWGLGALLNTAELPTAAPLHWKLEPPFMLLGLVILLDTAHRLLCNYKLRPLAAQIVEERCHAAALRRDASKLSAPETFAQAAKLQRRAIGADKALQRLSDQQARLQGTPAQGGGNHI